MPTSKPRVTFTLSEDELDCITDYQHGNKIKNQSQAILSLIRLGLNQVSIDSKTYRTMAEVAVSEMRLLQNYRELNEEGQEKLEDYSIDLVSSGRYIKSNTLGMDSKEA